MYLVYSCRCLLSHSYSLWFIHLPAFIELSSTVETAMKMAYDVLQKMQLAKLEPPDEVRYKVLITWCPFCKLTIFQSSLVLINTLQELSNSTEQIFIYLI